MEKSCCSSEEAKRHTEGKGESKGTSTKTYVILILFGLLFVFSVFQAIQISDIKEGLTSGQSAVYPAARAQAPQPRQQAPVMVGGC